MDTAPLELSGGQSELALALALDSIQQAQASMDPKKEGYTIENSYAEAPDPFDFVGMLPPKTLPKAVSEKDLAPESKNYSDTALNVALNSVGAAQASTPKLPPSRPTSRPSSQKGSQINLHKAVSQTLLPSTSQIRLDPKTAMSRSASQNSMKKVGRSQENMAKAASKKSLRWQDEAVATDSNGQQQGSRQSLIQEPHRAQSLSALAHQSGSDIPKASSHKSILKSDSRPQSAHDFQGSQGNFKFHQSPVSENSGDVLIKS
jgi:hypothetical protein